MHARLSVIAALAVALIDAHSLEGQTGSWQLVAGVGGVTGEPLAHSAVFIGSFGRDMVTSSRLQFGAALTTGHLPEHHGACVQTATTESCDVRDLAGFGALSIAAAVSVSQGFVTPYARGNVGAWMGRDRNAVTGQSSRESGATIVGETGIRLGHLAAAVRVDQLNGVRRGTVHIASIVLRVNF